MNAEIVEVKEPAEPRPVSTHPLAIIDRAIERGIDPDNLAKLMELQAKWEERRAAEVYASALANFQAECPMVFKSRMVKNKDGSPRYYFASYDDIRRATRPLEAKYGIATSFNVEQTEDGKLKATCRVRVGSHFEDYTFQVPIPKGMGTNDAQDYGAALSYVKRYCYCAALNIVVSDEDDDGQNLLEKINSKDLEQVRRIMEEKGFPVQRVLNWASAKAKIPIHALEEMPASLVSACIDTMRRQPVKGGGK